MPVKVTNTVDVSQSTLFWATYSAIAAETTAIAANTLALDSAIATAAAGLGVAIAGQTAALGVKSEQETEKIVDTIKQGVPVNISDTTFDRLLTNIWDVNVDSVTSADHHNADGSKLWLPLTTIVAADSGNPKSATLCNTMFQPQNGEVFFLESQPVPGTNIRTITPNVRTNDQDIVSLANFPST